MNTPINKPELVIKDNTPKWGDPDYYPSIPFLAKDGRTVALETLRDYLCTFEFNAPGKEPFKLNEDHFYIDGIESEDSFVMPCISVIPGIENRTIIGPYMIESTKDVFKKDYALVKVAETSEDIGFEIFAPTRQIRNGIVSALNQIFSPSQNSYGLKLVLPNYYYQPCRFSLLDINRLNDTGISNRWRALVRFTMDLSIVHLYHATQLQVLIGLSDDQLEDNSDE